MSGGVDSSVSAALLKQQGYDVTGVFIKAWEPQGFDCNWRAERRDAMRVAAVLDIPFITLDLAKEYKKEVVDYMVTEYKAGRTPNPDVMCNKTIKFGAFLKKARAMGADYVATGHYARVCRKSKVESQNQTKRIECEMLVGKDKEKDQSYFLWTLGQEQLSHTLFPVGHLEKSAVRQLATKFKLPTQAKKDSQGLCFIGKLDLKDFLSQFIKEKPGQVLDQDGRVIGRHRGVLFYTLGERHGFELTQKTAESGPLYVVAKDLKKNTLTVSVRARGKLFSQQEIELSDTSWISSKPPVLGKKYQCRFRYRQPLLACRLKQKSGGGNWIVQFDKPITAAAPGQSLVLYDGPICLGGGVIT